MRKTNWKRWLLAGLVCALLTFSMTFIALGEGDAAPATETTFTVDETEYDLTDGDSAMEYVGAYADNINADASFHDHLATALAKVRESIPAYASVWALLPPVSAIVLALITKEV